MASRCPIRAAEVLLIEDNLGDIRLMREALEDAGASRHISVVRDGVEALAYLRSAGGPGRPRPDLILIDLNLPRMSGREVIAEIKNDPELKPIPVIVLTTSKADEDIRDSYRLHANCYITKPAELDTYIAVVKAILDFWLNTVTLAPIGVSK